MFIDRARIHVKAGDGGRGCVAFRREKGVPRGGPSGGDGGRGGSVILVADRHMRTLVDFHFRPDFKAGRGQHGMGSRCNGRDAEDLVIRVPPGTVIREAGEGALLDDLAADGRQLVAAKGGKGGKGNQNFATATRQSPDWAEPGERGEERDLELELRILADVGLVGMPNAGKSLLLSKISAAHPRVAAFPFTTKEPNLGVVSLGPGNSFVVADLPGLLEGAHRGVGLGHEFLRHVSRTRVLVHVVDVGWEKPASEVVRDHDTVLDELRLYDPDLLTRPRVVAANKTDLPGSKKRFEALKKRASKTGGGTCLPISALTGSGVDRLVRAMQAALAGAPEPVLNLGAGPAVTLRPRGVAAVRVVRDRRGRFLVRSREAEKLVAGIDARSGGTIRSLQAEFRRLGVEDALKEAGARSGDRVRIGDLEFEYVS